MVSGPYVVTLLNWIPTLLGVALQLQPRPKETKME